MKRLRVPLSRLHSALHSNPIQVRHNTSWLNRRQGLNERQRKHILALLPTKSEEEAEEIRVGRREIWEELLGGKVKFHFSFYLVTDQLK